MNSTKDFTEAMNRIAARLVDKIKDEIANNNLVASGNLKDSVEYKLEGNDILVLANTYLPYAEFGRKSGKVPYNFADIIADWASRKGITPKKGTLKDFGWAVAMKTKKYGSARKRGAISIEDVINGPVNEIMDDTVTEEFAALLDERLDNIFK